MSAQSTASKPASVWKHGLAAVIVASAVVTGIAYAASQAGVSFTDPHPIDPAKATIPPFGFAFLTAAFSLVGVGLAAIFARKARRPRSTFVRTTLALLVLSIVPDFAAIPKLSPDWDTPTSWTLAALHVVAAAIVIPVLAGRLAEKR